MNDKIALLNALGVDISMILLRVIENHLISKEIAVKLAELIIAEQFGETELDMHKPLKLADDRDNWYISGARRSSVPTSEHNPVDTGIQITIAKADGQVLKFYKSQSFPSPMFSLEELAELAPEEIAKLSDNWSK